MKLKKSATAGTLESSDIKVLVEPAEENTIELESSVILQYGPAIRATIEDVLNRLDVQGVRIIATDKGALDCTIRARVETALFRGAEMTENLPWGTKI